MHVLILHISVLSLNYILLITVWILTTSISPPNNISIYLISRFLKNQLSKSMQIINWLITVSQIFTVADLHRVRIHAYLWILRESVCSIMIYISTIEVPFGNISYHIKWYKCKLLLTCCSVVISYLNTRINRILKLKCTYNRCFQKRKYWLHRNTS